MAHDMTVYKPTNWGQNVDIVIRDDDEVAIPIPDATSVVYEAIMPRGLGTKLWTGALRTDGTDGAVRYTLQPGDLGVAGVWQVRATATGPTYETTSKLFTMEVLA